MRYRYFFSPQVGWSSFSFCSLAWPLGKSPVTWLRLAPRMWLVALCSTVPVWTLMPGPVGVVVPGVGVAMGAGVAIGAGAVAPVVLGWSSKTITFLPALANFSRTKAAWVPAGRVLVSRFQVLLLWLARAVTQLVPLVETSTA
ncbi:hypothetical protein D3C72_597440 [compost metagenome]